MKLSDFIRTVEDFPKKGVTFRDITPLFLDPEAMAFCVDEFINCLPSLDIDKVVGVESRGFFIAPVLAQKLNAGFVPVRKSGKLPAATFKKRYNLEYGSDQLEVHKDAIAKNDKVLVHDDVLATGGTALTTCQMVEELGGDVVQCNFIIEIEALKGRAKLEQYPMQSLLVY